MNESQMDDYYRHYHLILLTPNVLYYGYELEQLYNHLKNAHKALKEQVYKTIKDGDNIQRLCPRVYIINECRTLFIRECYEEKCFTKWKFNDERQ